MTLGTMKSSNIILKDFRAITYGIPPRIKPNYIKYPSTYDKCAKSRIVLQLKNSLNRILLDKFQIS
jgi:hypothetical protein